MILTPSPTAPAHGRPIHELSLIDGYAKARFVQADLTDQADHRWREAIESSDAVAHFALRILTRKQLGTTQ